MKIFWSIILLAILLVIILIVWRSFSGLDVPESSGIEVPHIEFPQEFDPKALCEETGALWLEDDCVFPNGKG